MTRFNTSAVTYYNNIIILCPREQYVIDLYSTRNGFLQFNCDNDLLLLILLLLLRHIIIIFGTVFYIKC